MMPVSPSCPVPAEWIAGQLHGDRYPWWPAAHTAGSNVDVGGLGERGHLHLHRRRVKRRGGLSTVVAANPATPGAPCRTTPGGELAGSDCSPLLLMAWDNGNHDDGDSKMDHSDDPGFSGPGDKDEADSPVPLHRPTRPIRVGSVSSRCRRTRVGQSFSFLRLATEKTRIVAASALTGPPSTVRTMGLVPSPIMLHRYSKPKG